MFLPRQIALTGLLALAACSGRLDTRTVEANIKADIERQGRRLALQEVRCPTNILRQAEAYFRCVGELEPEGTFPINVIQQDAQGTVTWEIPNSEALLNLVVVETEIQSGLAKALGKQAYVDCGSELYRPNQAGDQFECQIIGGLSVDGGRVESVLVKVDSEGNLQWQEQVRPQSVGTAAALPPADTAAAPATQPIKTTTVTGPTGRKVTRPYVPGDDD